MKLISAASTITSLSCFAHAAPTTVQPREITTSWAGVNSYFLHAFQQADRLAVLDAVQAANLKYVRLFISYTIANNKGTGSVEMPDIEPKEVGAYDDTQLEAIDQLMVEAQARGIKLTIAIHDRYQLGCWGNDSYVTKYNLPAVDCAIGGPAAANNVTSFYQDPAPISDYDNRIQHVLEHQNTLIEGSPQWKDLSDYIFSFNIEKEAQGHLDNNTAPVPKWWCDRSAKMRAIMGDSEVLISTGGGNEFPNSDIPENWNCSTLDVVDIHSYDGVDGYKQNAPVALQHAKDADKLVLFEEFGATGADKANVTQQYIDVLNGLKVPWSIWEISKPGKGAADFEFWTDEPTYEVVKAGASEALSLTAAQPFCNLS